MRSSGRFTRAAALAAGSLLVGLALVGFTPPSLPTSGPALPLPTPSLPAAIQDLLSPAAGGQAATGGAAAASAPARGGAAGSTTLGSPASGSPASGAPAPAGRLAPGFQAAVVPQEQQPAQGGARLPGTGGSSGGGAGGPASPPPIWPGALAAVLLLLLYLGARLGVRPAARRHQARVEFAAGGPAGAAAAAVRCLLESELPAGSRIDARGDAAFAVQAPALQRAALGVGLTQAAARAGRVGLHLDWAFEPAAAGARTSARPRLAGG